MKFSLLCGNDSLFINYLLCIFCEKNDPHSPQTGQRSLPTRGELANILSSVTRGGVSNPPKHRLRREILSGKISTRKNSDRKISVPALKSSCGLTQPTQFGYYGWAAREGLDGGGHQSSSGKSPVRTTVKHLWLGIWQPYKATSGLRCLTIFQIAAFLTEVFSGLSCATQRDHHCKPWLHLALRGEFSSTVWTPPKASTFHPDL